MLSALSISPSFLIGIAVTAVVVGLVAWDWPRSRLSAAVFFLSALPAMWAFGEALAFADHEAHADAIIRDAIVVTLSMAVVLLFCASAAAAWSLLRRAPLENPALVVTAMVAGLALIVMHGLFQLGLFIFLLGD